MGIREPALLCALRRPWEEEREARAVAKLAFDPDPAAMRLNKAARDREPEARAARLAGAGPLAAEEAVEYVRQIGCGDALTGIDDIDLHAVRNGAGGDGDRAIRRSMAECILHEI